MKERKLVYHRIIFSLIFALTYFEGSMVIGPGVTLSGVTIFIIINFYYYLTNFMDFDYYGGKFSPWINSLIINGVLGGLLWTFSRSRGVIVKFILLWLVSNIIRMIISRFNKKKMNIIFVGSKNKFEELKFANSRTFLNKIKRVSLKSIIKNLEETIEKEKVDIVIVEEKLLEKYTREFLDLKLKGIKVFLPWQFRESVGKKILVDEIEEGWFLQNQGFNILNDGFEQKIKRIVDLIGVLIIGIVALPLSVLTVIGMKFIGLVSKKNRGPLFFKQKRIGLGEKPFEIIKFRSMIIKEYWESVGFDPEKEAWTEENDPRITPLGKFLRKTRLDELPQLLNILRGEMSFVGPRPESVSYVKILKEEIPFYEFRHAVLPGLTGWAQVMYPYGASVEDAKNKLEYDLYYIKHQSFVMDIMILLKTVKAVLFGRGR